MLDPSSGKECDAAWGMTSDEALLVYIFLGNVSRVFAEHLLKWGKLAHGKAKDGSLPKPFQRLDGITRKNHIVTMTIAEQFIQIAGDDNIKIKKQHRACKVGQPPTPKTGFAPNALWGYGYLDRGWRQGVALDLGSDAIIPVGETDKAKGRSDISLHHRIQPVNVGRAILGTPVDTDNLLEHLPSFVLK